MVVEQKESLIAPPCLDNLQLSCIEDCPVFKRSSLTFSLKGRILGISGESYVQALREGIRSKQVNHLLSEVQESINRTAVSYPINCARKEGF